MRRTFFLSCFLLSLFTPSPESPTTKSDGGCPRKLVVILLNSDDCRNCLKHDYGLIEELLRSYSCPQKIIIALSEKRPEAKENERAELGSLFDTRKATLVWNDALLQQLRKAAGLSPAMSSLVMFDSNYRITYSKAIKQIVSFGELKKNLD